MGKYQMINSSNAKPGGVKLLFWGDTSTRKTETVVRNFPNVLVVDSEGNIDMCFGRKDIPEFAVVKTKDPRDLEEIINDVAAGKIRMPNGDKVQTLCVDTISVFWGVQNEFAVTLAEKRASRGSYQKAEEADVTMGDWGKAKRPMKAVNTAINNSGIPYVVFIAREKDKYIDVPGRGEQAKKKDGVIPDVMKNTEYEMNLGLHFCFDENGKWYYEVSKVQGILNELFPEKSRGTKIPIEKLFTVLKGFQPQAKTEKSDMDIANSQAEEEKTAIPHTQTALVGLANSLGVGAPEVGKALKVAGITSFDPKKWDAMEKAIRDYAATLTV